MSRVVRPVGAPTSGSVAAGGRPGPGRVPLSAKGTDAVNRATDTFARDLRAEAERIGYRSGADAASRTHVAEAARHLYVGRLDFRKQALTTVGGLVSGSSALVRSSLAY